jgi:hypothetical protein
VEKLSDYLRISEFHGKIIEVTEDLGMLDGQAVELIVTASRP